MPCIEAFVRLKGASMLPTFELLFRVPAQHTLVLVRSRGRGGRMRGEFWSHQELDGTGAVIASYESYDEVDTHGHVQCGWRKYDAAGLLMEAQTVPESWSVRAEKEAELVA